MESKERLDVLLTKLGLAETREQAQRLIIAGQVTIKGQKATKVGHRFNTNVPIVIKERARFISRGGQKLNKAFEFFGLDVKDKICIDIGSSTGGFTDCMLQHGARLIFAVDTGKGQLHWKMRNDSRVVVMEKTNARYITPDDFYDVPSFATVDVSFISLTKILPALVNVITNTADIVTLIKPQFECGRDQVGKGGVVRDVVIHREVVEKIRLFGSKELLLQWVGVTESPIKGPAGNIEFLAYWKKMK